MTALPTTRPRTYVNGMPLIPDDINELFDAIIDAKWPLLTIPVGIFGTVNIGVAATPVAFTQSIVSGIAADLVASSTPLDAAIMINGMPNGTRIVNARVYLKDVSGQPAVQVSMRGGNRAGSSTADAVTGASAASGATQTITLLNINHVVGSTTLGAAYLFLNTLSNATGTYSIYAVEVDVDRL